MTPGEKAEFGDFRLKYFCGVSSVAAMLARYDHCGRMGVPYPGCSVAQTRLAQQDRGTDLYMNIFPANPKAHSIGEKLGASLVYHLSAGL